MFLLKAPNLGLKNDVQALTILLTNCVGLRKFLKLFYPLFSHHWFLSLFTYFERERKSIERAEREREREIIPSRLCTVSTEPDMELELTNGETMTWAETRSWMLNWLSHPGAPPPFLIGILIIVHLGGITVLWAKGENVSERILPTITHYANMNASIKQIFRSIFCMPGSLPGTGKGKMTCTLLKKLIDQWGNRI